MDTASAGHGPHPADDRSRPGTDDRPPDAHRSPGAHDRPPGTALRGGTGRSPDDAFRAVLCGDGLRRCPWAPTGPAALEEHDRRWGARPTGSSGWFEALGLEIFQAGLARWSIAQRREGLRRALRDFVPEEIARMTEDDVDELLLDPAVIRNRVKIEAVVHNARACRGLGPEDWAEHVRDLRPAAAEPPLTVLEESRRSPEGDRLAARLKEQGLVFVGRTTAHRFLLRTGVLPGHLAGCFRDGTGTGGSG
ncbi:DNA-3-methyladenine glycosylase I [Kocuria rosea]|uniref:DNA-3-methyladenine glycosylase I n=1 Tax=Kocuria rosea TaxID=1275 RepID=UPI00068E8AB8|nr:DNA-3-methyladenine glycosylase I [Kocuria polaris]